MKCNICSNGTTYAFPGKILNKYSIRYFRCSNCNFLQTEEPYWLEEAYSSAISELDIGPINRAICGSRIIESTIAVGFDPNAKFVDWGGGYGVLTRLMRDRGYDYYWRDLHCDNIFAKQFVAKESMNYELLTAFEVFEHFINPTDEIEKMLAFCRNILFTTEIPQSSPQNSTDWWYLTPETGQHISIYSLQTLQYLAKKFNLHLSTNGSSVHLFSQKSIPPRLFELVASDGWVSKAIRILGRRRLHRQSLLQQDFRELTGWKI